MNFRDSQSLRKFAWTAAQVAQVIFIAPAFHKFETVRRLKRANQHRLRNIFQIRHDVEAEIFAVNLVNVSVAARAELNFRACRPPLVGMRRRVKFAQIRLGFDNYSGSFAVHQLFSNQFLRDD